MTSIICSLHPHKFSKKPSQSESFPGTFLSEAALVSSTIPKYKWEGDLEDFARAMEEGRTWSSIFREKRRKSDWIKQQLLGVDIDGNLPCTVDEIPEFSEEKINCRPFLVHHTMSSTYENPKLRVIYKTNKVIDNSGLVEGCLEYLRRVFQADPAVVDVSRLFYGGLAGSVTHLSDDSITDEVLGEAQEVLEGIKQKQEETIRKLQQRKQSGFVNYSDVDRMLAYAFRDPVKFAGSGYMTIFKVALYCYDNGIEVNECIAMMEKMRLGHKRTWNNSRHDIAKVVLDAIEWKISKGG